MRNLSFLSPTELLARCCREGGLHTPLHTKHRPLLEAWYLTGWIACPICYGKLYLCMQKETGSKNCPGSAFSFHLICIHVAFIYLFEADFAGSAHPRPSLIWEAALCMQLFPKSVGRWWQLYARIEQCIWIPNSLLHWPKCTSTKYFKKRLFTGFQECLSLPNIELFSFYYILFPFH